ncbi:MAG TPA: ABC transporter permease [Acidobacteriota bacterium]|nr:ABC transporter permease [Acidobacteriota bacterium]
MKLKLKLLAACLKMFFREKEAVFWTLFFPIFMIVLFGFVRFDSFGRVETGVVNLGGAEAKQILDPLSKIETIRIHQGSKENEMKELTKGERDIVIIIPENYRSNTNEKVEAYLNDAKPQEARLGLLLLQQTLDQEVLNKTQTARTVLEARSVRGRKLTYMDFLIPGILAMSVMQMGVFSVAFVFVDLKKRGILRRIRVTPINPNDFIAAQVLTRLIVLMLQIMLMVAVGMLFFKLHFTGNLLNLFAVGVLGAVVFLAIGFAVAGVSKSEEQVAPLANVIVCPMMLLSGIFFSRNNLPGFVKSITNFFPLTYLADAMRSISIDGATLSTVFPQVAGLFVWAVLACIIAVKMFRWE